MALDGIVDDINEVPEGLRDHYVKNGEKWHLEATGLVSKDRLSEFRENNVALKKSLAQYEDIDVEEYRQLKDTANKLRDKKLLDSGKIEELFNERLNPIKSEKERMEKEYKDQISKKDAQLAKFMIDNEIRSIAEKHGAHTTAVDDLILRGHQVFKMQGDKVVAINGDQPIFGKNGDPLGFDEWIRGVSEKAPHLFASSQGGEAPRNGSNSSKSVSNVSKENFLSNIDDIASGKKRVV